MNYIKKINNNVALSKDDKGNEFIIFGKGIGFGYKAGDKIDETVIEKVFVSQDEENDSRLIDVFTDIEPKIIAVTNQIIELAEQELSISFSTNNFIGLADHLNHAITRAKNHDTYDDFLSLEIEQFYSQEYAVAKQAIKLIDEKLDISLPSSEEIYLTYHFFYANSSLERMDQVAGITHLIQRVLTIVRYHFQSDIDTDTISYSRFITHLRYFILRHMTDEKAKDILPIEMFSMVKTKYPESYACVSKISQFLYEEKKWRLSYDEELYLTIHIERIRNINH
ncbi:hypothetical protein BW731_07075 [Vagococcus martis]|uniref:PRD domain-containing protein n=1 Tax=Vagococcus martis TaxID=1768210 RepID=A0A1V4DHI9_9ENTE|nr:PRD domain-containing protein [Vagococcus martis]OPF87948.1 hypothetical protein BW731_07075 [Vagococcus martis]